MNVCVFELKGDFIGTAIATNGQTGNLYARLDTSVDPNRLQTDYPLVGTRPAEPNCFTPWIAVIDPKIKGEGCV